MAAGLGTGQDKEEEEEEEEGAGCSCHSCRGRAELPRRSRAGLAWDDAGELFLLLPGGESLEPLPDMGWEKLGNSSLD